MDQPQNFRSALGGFNREDVVHYLEYLNNKHHAEISRLNTENDQLRAQLSDVNPELLRQQEERCEELEAQLDAANAERAELEKRIAELEARLAAAPEQPLVVEAPQAEEKPEIIRNSAVQELEAYRRAERAERMAKERAEQIYQQTDGILNDATLKVDGASQQINTVTEQVVAQLNLLQCAVNSSRLALQEAAAIMSTLRPKEE